MQSLLGLTYCDLIINFSYASKIKFNAKFDKQRFTKRKRKRVPSSLRRVDQPPNEEIVEEIHEDTVEENDRDDDEEEDIGEVKSDEDDVSGALSSTSQSKRDESNGKPAVEATAFSGQPIDPSLLCYYGDHIARLVWEISNPRKNPRPLLRLQQHQDMVKTMWPIDKECVKVQEHVQKSGLYPLIKHGHDKIDRALINAFCERWYPETNTYHLPFGEMTPTIEDVERITGLAAKGENVDGKFSGKSMTWENMYALIKRTLGKTKAQIQKDKALGGIDKKLEKRLKLKWLRDKFKSKENDSKKRKEQCARAYLLYVIGSIICSDKSGASVHVYFLQCLEDLNRVNTYSWATACLAWIYHHLGQGSRSEVSSMAGCMTVLQVWVYDHFPILERHDIKSGYEKCDPRAALYVAKQPERNLDLELVELREKLDDLTVDEVTWDPYKLMRDGSVPQIAHYIGPLKCFEVVEWHNPNRVLRQFGAIQDEPSDVFLDKNKTVSKPRSFRSYYPCLDGHNCSVWDKSSISEHILQSRVINPWDCKDGYMDWFSKVSHTRVANLFPRNPAKAFIQGEQTKAALIKRNIGKILDVVSSSGAKDEPISPSTKARIISMLENVDNPHTPHLFLHEDDIPGANWYKTQDKKQKKCKKRSLQSL
ncbi:protein MAIN-LIKE 1-like isoform X1 [Papaver somniferum]|uniref:protein MAIN-LIKE 1-like isoform X1 n=1 Tax=Papaver somniferum TaxID=3469 RepID=UPI000E700C91|nr:protein MAIN-LIKE 1-like isoform X1 [Papaver somniferum]